MTTSSAPLRNAASCTCWIIGFSPIRASGFPGRRCASWRAGMPTLKRIVPSGRLLVAQCLDLFLGQLTCFFLQHHRNAVTNRIRQARRPRKQFLTVFVVDKRPFGHRADEDLKQLAVQFAASGWCREADPRTPDPAQERWAGSSNRPERMDDILLHLFRSSLSEAYRQNGDRRPDRHDGP